VKTETPCLTEAIRKKSQTEESTFFKNFNEIKKSTSQNQVETRFVSLQEQKSMRMTHANRELLKQSIVISLDFPVDRPDLEFVANSRVDGKSIYRYIGQMPFNLDIPFEELISLEGIREIKSEEIFIELSEHENIQVIQIQENMSFAEKLDRDIHNAIQRIHTSEWDFKPFDRTK
jgi:hypothetical protein